MNHILSCHFGYTNSSSILILVGFFFEGSIFGGKIDGSMFAFPAAAPWVEIFC